MAEQIVNGLASGSWYALMGLALVLILRATDVPNFAMAEIGLIPAFVLWTVTDAGLPYGVAVIVALATGAALAMVVERLLIRPILAESHFATVLMTIGAFVGLNSVTQLVWGSTPRDIDAPFGGSFVLGGIRITADQMLSVAVAAVVAVVLARFFRTRRGVEMRAVAEDRVTPRLLGVSLPWVFRTAWGVAGAIAAGAMILQAQSTLVTDQNGGPIILKGFVAATVGGFTSVAGAFWAGLGLGVVENIAGYSISTSSRPAVALLAILAVLLLRPQGLFGRARTREV